MMPYAQGRANYLSASLNDSATSLKERIAYMIKAKNLKKGVSLQVKNPHPEMGTLNLLIIYSLCVLFSLLFKNEKYNCTYDC